MIWQLIKKELLLFWRRPRELVVLLLMPFVLITILGAALGAINDGETENLTIKLAVMNKDDFQSGEDKILRMLEDAPMTGGDKEAAVAGIKGFNPIRILLEDVLQGDELKKLVELDFVEGELTEKEAEAFNGMVEIPPHFTEHFFLHAYFGKGEVPELNLKLNESSSLKGSILLDIFTSFQEEITFWTVAQQSGINVEELQAKLVTAIGTTKSVSEKNPINSVSYYAIGMSVMFMFYVAGHAATLAFEEKENHIFGRILLANTPIPIFFSGIFVSTLVVAFLQINILFGLSALIHQVHWPSTMNYFIVTFLLSCMVGSFATFIAAISYRINSGGSVQVFSSFLIPIIAFIGGSFVPVAQLGSLFETISKYSPGGAGISAYYKIMQGYSMEDITVQLISLFVTTFILLVSAYWIQPKRGESV